MRLRRFRHQRTGQGGNQERGATSRGRTPSLEGRGGRSENHYRDGARIGMQLLAELKPGSGTQSVARGDDVGMLGRNRFERRGALCRRRHAATGPRKEFPIHLARIV
jgi:hypothetical protein